MIAGSIKEIGHFRRLGDLEGLITRPRGSWVDLQCPHCGFNRSAHGILDTEDQHLWICPDSYIFLSDLLDDRRKYFQARGLTYRWIKLLNN